MLRFFFALGVILAAGHEFAWTQDVKLADKRSTCPGDAWRNSARQK